MSDCIASKECFSSCVHDTPKRPCSADIEAACRGVDDTFAMLRGRAIRAYLHEPFAHYCTMQNGNTLFGDVLANHSCVLRDIRFVSRFAIGGLFRDHETCSTSRARMPGAPFLLTSSSLRAVPLGAWDQRRYAYCAAARNGTERNLCVAGCSSSVAASPSGTCAESTVHSVKQRSNRANAERLAHPASSTARV